MKPINTKWPGFSDAEWVAQKAVARGAYRPSEIMVNALISEIDALRAMVRTQDEALTEARAESTRQCDQIRGLRRILDACGVDGEPQRDVLIDVIAERYRQDCKWGPASSRIGIPDGTGSREGFDAEAYAAAAKEACDMAFASGNGSLRHILDEEVAEVVAETKPSKLRAELVQVAACAVLWVEIIDMRGEK